MSSLKTTHRWAVAQQNPELEKELSAGLGIPGLVARIMVAHGIGSIKEGQLFLTPSLDRDWADPLIIPGMSVVADRVERAIRNHEHIAVFGDFDVDGITSTCLLTEALRTFGADVTPFIPHRFDEGYGLSRAALDRVNELARPQLIVTVDNGIAAKEEVSYLESLGIDLVVTDHHEPSDQVPQGVPLTDPKLEDEGPSRELAGAGVALKLVQVLGERLGKPSYWRSLIEVAALGTVSDMMPLTPENRALVAEGIQQMRVTARPGYIALAALAKADLSSITADGLSFSLIPRLNAAGRMADPKLALDLLLARNPIEASTLAAELEEINRQRREMAERMALNAPIQGSAADIIKVAMLDVESGLARAGLRSRMLLRSLFSGDKAEAAEEERLCSQDKTFVTRLREIIQQHLADSDFSVERLGEEIGLSRVQLYRKVKVLTGKTPVEFIRHIRLQRASVLLREGRFSVSEVMYMVGFSNSSYFSKCFQAAFGKTPRQYVE